MKKNLHPEYKEIKVIMTNGEEFITKSTLKQDEIKLDIDIKSHPAWTGTQRLIDTGGQLAKFNKKFKDIQLKE